MPDLLPPNATPLERGLGLSTARDIDVPLKQLWSPYTCPPEVLSYLAWALSVDEWNPTADEATKRQIIAASVEDHRRKGTVGALKKALQRLGLECEIDENTGTAYTFRLKRRIFAGQSAGGAVMEAEQNAAIAIALRQKNARSELIGTSLFADTSPAPAYIGAVAIGGVDCSIVQPPTPLPLDGYRDGLAASFWTVRMQTDYAGPIGIVKRSSDNAELTYYSLAELKAFVGLGSWQYLALYSQSRYWIKARASVALAGGFDSNGNPYIESNGDPLIANYPRTNANALTLASVFQNISESVNLLSLENLEIESLTTSLYSSVFQEMPAPPYYFNSFGIENGYAGAAVSQELPTPITLFTQSVIARANAVLGENEVTDGTDSTLNENEFRGLNVKRIKLGYGGAINRFYGAAFWDTDLGSTTCVELAETLNDKFQE